MQNKYVSFFIGLAVMLMIGNVVLKAVGLQPVGLWMFTDSATAQEAAE